VSPRIIRLAPVAVLAWLALSAVAQPASAVAPCWKKLMNDWYSPPINNVYPIPCYHEAIKHLPTDVSVYSSARDDIERALQQAIAGQKKSRQQVTTITPVTTTDTTPTTTRTTGTTGTTTETTPTATTPKKKPRGPIGKALRDITPGGADSFPLPLLILGLLAILLVAAGVAGLVWKRLQLRRGGP
jgi:cobalamin biosynthesis Mg chelatase CobN